jgi:tetratricopeptide (TPR) repeat protein
VVTVLACLIFIPAVADELTQGPWTAQDRDEAIVTATATAGSSSGLLMELADTLARAGDAARAHELVLKAASVLGPPNDHRSSFARERVVEKLAELGDVGGAEALVSADAAPPVKAMLLGEIGAARARAGDLVGAQAQVAAITALSGSDGTSIPHLADASTSAMREIGLALDAADKPDAALQLATGLPDGLPKVWILGRSAEVFCGSADRVGERQRGREVAERAAQSARVALSGNNAAQQQFGLVTIAGEALAECNGADAAVTLVRELSPAQEVPIALGRMADQFIADGNPSLARAIAPSPDPPDPTNVEDLLDAAKRSAKQGDFDAARAMALRASRIATGITRNPADPAYKWYDHEALVGRIFGELVELGAYDDAIATVQPIEMVNRQQYYVSVLAAEVAHNDTAAVRRTLPVAIEAVKAPTSGNRSADLLYRLTRVLATQGYRDAAREPYSELQAMLKEPPANGFSTLEPFKLAQLQVAMGDLPGALATADRAGPLTRKGSGMDVAVYLGLMKGRAPAPNIQSPEAESISSRDFAGPRAGALSAIASELAVQGEVPEALRVEAELESGQGDSLTGLRDSALAAITDAQVRAGDLRGALSTVRRITQPTVRWKPLLKLVTTQTHQ